MGIIPAVAQDQQDAVTALVTSFERHMAGVVAATLLQRDPDTRPEQHQQAQAVLETSRAELIKVLEFLFLRSSTPAREPRGKRTRK